jgi:hypothetical protein
MTGFGSARLRLAAVWASTRFLAVVKDVRKIVLETWAGLMSVSVGLDAKNICLASEIFKANELHQTNSSYWWRDKVAVSSLLALS